MAFSVLCSISSTAMPRAPGMEAYEGDRRDAGENRGDGEIGGDGDGEWGFPAIPAKS